MAEDLRTRFGTARRPERPVEHDRTPGSGDALVAAVGKVSAAFERIEQARGLLYGFHRMSGMADLDLQEALTALRDAGQSELADEIDDVLVGRDVVGSMWTFQMIESYDRQYYQVFKAADEKVRELLSSGRPHVFEAELKVTEQRGASQ